MPENLDIDILRRAGLLPLWQEEWPGQPGSPAAMRNVNVAPAPRIQPPRAQPTTQPFPWTMETPSETPGEPPQRVTGPFAQITSTPEGGTITAPEGTATFERETPEGLAQWLARKRDEQQAQEAAAQRRAQLASAAATQREAQTQAVLQEILQRHGPLEYLKAVTELRKTQMPAGTGSASAQAFRQIMLTQGLDAALQWLNNPEQVGGRRGPLTPNEVYARTLAEQEARFGPRSQYLRGETAASVRAGSQAGLTEATMKLPVLQKRANWVNPATGEFARESDTPDRLIQHGFRFVDDKARQATATSRAALAQLREYRELVEGLLPDVTETGGLTGWLQNVGTVQGNRARIAALRAAGDPAARRLEGMFGTIATIARATGDTANIAVQERRMLQESVVTPSDSKQSGLAKLDQLERVLKAVLAGWGTTVAYEQETGRGGAPTPPPPGGRPGRYRMDDGTIQTWDGRQWLSQ